MSDETAFELALKISESIGNGASEDGNSLIINPMGSLPSITATQVTTEKGVSTPIIKFTSDFAPSYELDLSFAMTVFVAVMLAFIVRDVYLAFFRVLRALFGLLIPKRDFYAKTISGPEVKTQPITSPEKNSDAQIVSDRQSK